MKEVEQKIGEVVSLTPDRPAEAIAWMTPERLPALDAMTDEDIAEQIASDPNVAPELTDEWFEDARLVIQLKGRWQTVCE